MFHTSLVRDMLLLYGQPQQVPYTIITEQVLYATGNVPSWHTAAHVLLQAMPEHVPFLRSTLHVPMRPNDTGYISCTYGKSSVLFVIVLAPFYVTAAIHEYIRALYVTCQAPP